MYVFYCSHALILNHQQTTFLNAEMVCNFTKCFNYITVVHSGMPQFNVQMLAILKVRLKMLDIVQIGTPFLSFNCNTLF